jgi:uncharacterized protein (DUF2141 family)
MFYRTLAVAWAAGFAVAAVSAQSAPPQPPAGTGVIVGQVVDAATGRGVSDVSVTPVLSKDVTPGGNANARAILTDADGRFVLDGLPAGSYQLFARRTGYVDDFYGASVSGGEGKPIVLDEGGRFVDATIRLWKLAVIAGRVVDEAGEPVIGLQIRALRRTLVAGRWKFGEYYSEQKYASRTDDRGIYRIASLQPGAYIVSVPLTSAVAPASAIAAFEALRNDPASRAAYVAAAESFSGSGAPMSGDGFSRTFAVGDLLLSLAAPGLAPVARGDGPVLMYETQFYPNVTTASAAQAIRVQAGEERGGIDFAMKPIRTRRVSGTVTGPGGPAAGLVLRLGQNDDSVLHDTEVATTISGPNGAFTFLGVPPGQYTVRVLRVGRPPQMTTTVGSVIRSEQGIGSSPDPTLWANVPVSVGDADVTDVGVTLNTGVRTSGRIVFAGTAKPTTAQLASLEIAFELADGRRPSRFGDDRLRPAGETFVTPELAPGKYLIRTSSLPSWRMKSAVAGERDISDVPLVVDGREIPPITITFTDRPSASLSGTVRASGSPAADAMVLVFPIERDAWLDYGNTPRRLRRARVTHTGAYAITDVPRGDYHVAALADDRSEDWRDPKHLDAVARVATRVTIADDESKTLDLSVQRVQLIAAASRRIAAVTPAEANAQRPVHETPAGSSGPFAGDAEQSQQPGRDSTPAVPQPAGTGAITGVVVSDDAAASPVRRVVVTINCTEPRVGRTGVTDDAGRFAFLGLPAGRYSVAATKPGYIAARYGATKAGRAGTPITLAADGRSAITVKIMRGAVITGVIRDARGEPFHGVRVSASQYQFSSGERRLAQSGSSVDPTDDRGQYRIFGLEPGEYFVHADRANVGRVYRNLRQTTAGDIAAAQRDVRATATRPAVSSPAAVAEPLHPDVGYAPVFYPGTPMLSQAAAVTVAAGEERTGVDIAIKLVALARVRARVVGPDGQPPALVQARLVAVTPLPGFSVVGLDAGLLFPVTDGNVQIVGIPPGEYVLHVGGSTVPPPPPASRGGFSVNPNTTLNLPMWATVPLTIDGQNVDQLDVRLEQGKQMKGRVVFEGTTPAPTGAPVQIFLRGPQFGGVMLSKSGPASPEFSFDGVVPAPYRVSTAAVRGWMLKSAIVNGRDASDLPVEINADVTEAVITLTDKLTELSGVLQTPAGAPAPDYFVIVFPKDSAYWLNGSRRIVSLRPATDGRFATTAANPLPPGDYLIAAVTDVNNGEWFDPAFLNGLTAAAIPVTIREGEKKRQDIQIR